MNANRSPMSSLPTRLLLLLIPAAFLTACSSYSELTADFLKHADDEAKIVKAAAIVEARPELPELPANLKRCLSASRVATVKPVGKQAKKAAGKKDQKADGQKAQDAAQQSKSPSADALVLKNLEDQKRRAACADAILRWYDTLRKSQQKVAAVGTVKK